jgi:dihydroorotase
VGIEADAIGVNRGVTAVIDGGSAGATTFPGFRTHVVRPARTRVYALLNISSPGMTVPNETSDLAFLNPETAAAAIRANRDVIVGLKVRMLAGIPDGQDLEVMRRTRTAADLAGVPITVHIGGQTSPLPLVLDLLRPGDVVTHTLRRQGSVLDPNGRVYPEVLEAVRNGVHLDIGHGRGNLDFDIAEQALAQGVVPTVISSDVHRGNAVGPVFDLPTTLSKFMQMGMSLEDVIRCATAVPGRIFELGGELGTLKEGAPADVSVFELTEGEYEFVDSGGKRRTGTQRLAPYAAIRDGRWFGLTS